MSHQALLDELLLEARNSVLLGADHTTKPEYSWFMEFDLGYKSTPPKLLEPVIKTVMEDVYKTYNPKHQTRTKPIFEYCIRQILLNLINLRQYSYPIYLKIHLNSNEYSGRYAPKNASYRMFKEAYECLIGLEYVKVHKKGSYHRIGDNEDLDSLTRIIGTDKLYALLPSIEDETLRFRSKAKDGQELIILKDSLGDKSEYEDNAYTRKARSNLNKINRVLKHAEIELIMNDDQSKKLKHSIYYYKVLEDKIDDIAPILDYSRKQLCRIYNIGSFEQGGRFFRGWWQSIPKGYRRLIKINGCQTVEIDYKTLHPNMLYAISGNCLDFDPYRISDVVCRNAGKIAFNALINISSKRIPKQPEGFVLLKKNGEVSHDIEWSQFCEMMMDAHKPIHSYFRTGYGLRLMNFDAAMAEKVMLHFARDKVPCLPVHDSFIVPIQYDKELEAVMLSAYREVMQTMSKSISRLDIQVSKVKGIY